MLKTFNMATPSKSILAPTIPYIGAFTSVRWQRSSKVEAGVRGGGGGGGGGGDGGGGGGGVGGEV